MKNDEGLMFAETFAFLRSFAMFVKNKYPEVYEEYIGMEKKNDETLELFRKKIKEQSL